jgi:triacylglycerol lipase
MLTGKEMQMGQRAPNPNAPRITARSRLLPLATMVVTACLGGCASPNPAFVAAPEAGQEAVILVHGLARTSRSMVRMEKRLTGAGYAVHSLQYRSRRKTVERIAEEDLAPFVATCQRANPTKIHFVAHSLGSIVVRQYLAQHKLPNVGRVVMLGPPNQGSEVVDRLGGCRLFGWLNGPAGRQLGTSSDSLPSRLPAPKGEVGVIAGTRSINWILSAMIPGPDDGKVSVARTKLPGMVGFVTVPVPHPFLMRNRKAIALTLAFLQDGAFGTGVPSNP